MSKLGKRLFAWFFHNVLGGEPDSADPFTRDVRVPLVEKANGDVLEIGAGDGGNLPFYNKGVRLTLLEPNPFMIRYLREACDSNGVHCVDVIEGFGEKLPFPDRHFDTVISTHVLCSVIDQAQVLSEVQRVLRPGGRFIFLEHVAAHPDTPKYTVQRVINPAWKAVGDGCHLTRDTGAMIEAAGFRHAHVNHFDAPFPGLVSPHVSGWAEV